MSNTPSLHHTLVPAMMFTLRSPISNSRNVLPRSKHSTFHHSIKKLPTDVYLLRILLVVCCCAICISYSNAWLQTGSETHYCHHHLSRTCPPRGSLQQQQQHWTPTQLSASSINNDASKSNNNNNNQDDADNVNSPVINGGYDFNMHNQHHLNQTVNDMRVGNDSVLLDRLSQLEELVAKQSTEIQRLQQTCIDLSEAMGAFLNVAEMLKAAGLTQSTEPPTDTLQSKDASSVQSSIPQKSTPKVLEAWEDSRIFGQAPSSILEAADAAGSAILAGILGGQLRMLVDVRDAELSSDPETFVQFLELAILPVAAGLEGLRSKRNRLKLVFPTVGQLLLYRRTMALAAPDVVALSTMGLEPIEVHDNLVVIVAPAPDNDEAWDTLRALLTRVPAIQQPIVVMNLHMLPIAKLPTKLEVAYHLRLLSVQYMTGETPPIFQPLNASADAALVSTSFFSTSSNTTTTNSTLPDDAALEAAVQHAHEHGTHVMQGTTRAMVIRAFPRPWHVFVDVSPDTNADFVIAETFDVEPTSEQVNQAIVECLQGSEREDELVAQQMQEALESGQLDRISEMLKAFEDELSDEEDDYDDDDDLWKMFREDSV
jgi:hypothetical protein